MKKAGIVCSVVCMSVLAFVGGCSGRKEEPSRTGGASGEIYTEGTVKTGETGEEGKTHQDTRIPETCQGGSKSGKVIFDCTLEVPETVRENGMKKLRVEGVRPYDREKVYSYFAEGKKVAETFETPADKNQNAGYYYNFTDGASLGLDTSLSWGSENSAFYSLIGAASSENQHYFAQDSVSFMSQEECMEKVKTILEEVGYPTEDLSFSAYPLSAASMNTLQEDEIEAGLLEPEKKKELTEGDEAYFVYAYQEQEEIPIFHELMSVARLFAFDTPDNGPIRAICSPRGLEQLNIDYVYQFTNEQEPVQLQPFETIRSVVEEKYENMLDDSVYEVTRAKLFRRIYTDEKQSYAEEPIWYFEVTDTGAGTNEVMLVNAETGKEISLP